MTTAMFLYMTGILWWILAGVVVTVVFNAKDNGTVILGNIVAIFIFVGAAHFLIAWLMNVGALPASWTFFD